MDNKGKWKRVAFSEYLIWLNVRSNGLLKTDKILIGWHHSQFRVRMFAIVIENLLLYLSLCHHPGIKTPPGQQCFPLQCCLRWFGDRIIPTLSSPAHGAVKTEFLKHRLNRLTTKLGASITMGKANLAQAKEWRTKIEKHLSTIFT